jgi:inhibitor of cysteine peptidase
MVQTTLTTGDDGRAIDVRYEETLRIELAETPTAGYHWQLEVIGPAIADVVRSGYAPAVDARIGGGGIRTFELRAQKRGTTRVRLMLGREWEKSTPPVKQFEITINVT